MIPSGVKLAVQSSDLNKGSDYAQNVVFYLKLSLFDEYL